MMESVSSKKIKMAGRLMLPQLLLVFLLLISLVSLPIPYASPVKPYLVLMAIYYWSIYRPTIIPPLLCFVIGVLLDILSGTPPGLNAFILVGVHWIVRDQRRFLTGQPYITIWAVFGLVAFICGTWQWALLGLINLQWGSPIPGITAILLTVFLFPFVTLILNLVHRILPATSSRIWT
jgi:rod shape-determining protein MreD